MEHTPGPWEFVPMLTASENHKGFFVRAEKSAKNGKWALAEVRPGDEDGRLGEANARLIAAAPLGLEAAEAVELALKMGHSPADLLADGSPIRDGLRDFIRAARGAVFCDA